MRRASSKLLESLLPFGATRQELPSFYALFVIPANMALRESPYSRCPAFAALVRR